MFRFSLDLKDPFWWYWIAAFLFCGAAVVYSTGSVRVAGLLVTQSNRPMAFLCVLVVLCTAAIGCICRGVRIGRRSKVK
jgi:hypothetical protein